MHPGDPNLDHGSVNLRLASSVKLLPLYYQARHR